MTFNRTTVTITQSVRARVVAILTCSFMLLASLAVAGDAAKPAQRKRLGGLKPMTKAQIEDFLSERRNATIATINKDGTPQVTPVIYYWDGATFYFSVTKETVKYKNLKRDSRMKVIVDDVLDHHCVIAKGKATIQEDNIWDMTDKIIDKYYGSEEGEPYSEQLKKQHRVLIVFKPTKIQAWGPIPR